MRRLSVMLPLALITFVALARVAVHFSTTPSPSSLEAHSEAPAPVSPPASEGKSMADAGTLAKISSSLIPDATAQPSEMPTAETKIATNTAEPQNAAHPDSGADDATLDGLRQRKNMLDARELALNEREEAMRKAEEKLKEQIALLEQLESRIRQRLEEEKKIGNKKIKRLAAVYEGMKPDRAAPVVEKMELDIVVRMFSLMDEKKVGKILSFLPAEKAVQISQALTRRIGAQK